MKHASAHTIESLAPLLATIRELGGPLKGKKPGTFYRKGTAFLHFHEDPAGYFADVKLDGITFERFPVNSAKERMIFVGHIRDALAG